MLSDEQLGAEVRTIFDLPIGWQGKLSKIQNLKTQCAPTPPENIVGSPERNAIGVAKLESDRDTKSKYRTAPGKKPMLRDPDPPRYIGDEEEPEPKKKARVAKSKSSKPKKAKKD